MAEKVHGGSDRKVPEPTVHCSTLRMSRSVCISHPGKVHCGTFFKFPVFFNTLNLANTETGPGNAIREFCVEDVHIYISDK